MLGTERQGRLWCLLPALIFLGVGCGADRSFKFKLVVKSGFRGDILLVRDKSFVWTPDQIYTLDATKGSVKVPDAVLVESCHVVEVRDETGKVLSRELRYNSGDIGITATVKRDDKTYYRIGDLAP